MSIRHGGQVPPRRTGTDGMEPTGASRAEIMGVLAWARMRADEENDNWYATINNDGSTSMAWFDANDASLFWNNQLYLNVGSDRSDEVGAILNAANILRILENRIERPTSDNLSIGSYQDYSVALPVSGNTATIFATPPITGGAIGKAFHAARNRYLSYKGTTKGATNIEFLKVALTGVVAEGIAGLTVAKGRMTEMQLVTRAAQKAEAAIGGTGNVAGTLKHTYAKNLLSRYQSRFGGNLSLGSNYFNNGIGNRGFLDVVNHSTKTIYDFKFGGAVMNNAQFLKYSRNFEGYGIHIIRP